MFSTTPFDLYPEEYEMWFDKNKNTFESELSAIKFLFPKDASSIIEVGLATGRFSAALGIKAGIEPSREMRKRAIKRGIQVMDAIAEKLPYANNQFEVVLMVSCISYFTNINLAVLEAYRVLKKGGALIIGFIDKESLFGRFYEQKRQYSNFYKLATFYTPRTIIEMSASCGFRKFEYCQTLFQEPGITNGIEPVVPGYGKGSFVVIKAIKEDIPHKYIPF